MALMERFPEHEQVIFCHDPESGLRAIIALHDTTLGPALGGCRMRPYGSVEEALQDVLRLAEGMTYKCAAADLDFGGGKAVILGDPRTDKSPELFRALGRFVAGLGGRFYTGTDMGTYPEDFVHAAKECPYIVGLPEAYGGGGDSSVPTAYGVVMGIKATAKQLWGRDDLSGRTFAVQGLGKVGFKVVERLWDEGAAKVYVTDVQPEALDRIVQRARARGAEVEVVDGAAIYDVPCDVFVPCAVGGILNDETIPRLQCRAVVGAANNQLLEDRHGDELARRGILYAPDYVVNAGGLIQVADELYGFNRERVMKKTEAIYDMVLAIYRLAHEEGLSTHEAARRLVKERIARRRRVSSIFIPGVAPKWRLR
ncbi:leucine dehydrogenase [Calditerricola yamamurae]